MYHTILSAVGTMLCNRSFATFLSCIIEVVCQLISNSSALRPWLLMKPWLRPPLLLRQMFCSSSKYKLSFSVPRPVLSHHALAWKHFPGHKGLKYLGMTAQETLSFEWSFSVCLIMLFSPAEETIGYLPLSFSYTLMCVCVYVYTHTYLRSMSLQNFAA